jgi:hypothetical protein
VENIPLQAERHSGQATKTVRLATGIGVRFQTGILFGFTTEWCSASDRNRVHLRPDSPFGCASYDNDTVFYDIDGLEESLHSAGYDKTGKTK